jgi:hypothetical protein
MRGAPISGEVGLCPIALWRLPLILRCHIAEIIARKRHCLKDRHGGMRGYSIVYRGYCGTRVNLTRVCASDWP